MDNNSGIIIKQLDQYAKVNDIVYADDLILSYDTDFGDMDSPIYFLKLTFENSKIAYGPWANNQR